MKSGQDVESIIDLDALRGWREKRDPALRQPHRLEALAELLLLDENDRPRQRYPVHGTDVLLGRFQAQFAPVDILFPDLADHEIYRLGAPHAHLFLTEKGWQFRPLTPRSHTALNGNDLESLTEAVTLNDGDVLTLGVARFRFHPRQGPAKPWIEARSRLLGQVSEPALFLKRWGSPCGPCFVLSPDEPVVLGRSYPEPGLLPNTSAWPEAREKRWDLSGLFDYERRHVSFRHAAIVLRKGQWTIEPLSPRQRTFVNRIALSGRMALESGDEIALGSVLFRFHHPHRAVESSRPRHVPTIIDWGEGLPLQARDEDGGV